MCSSDLKATSNLRVVLWIEYPPDSTRALTALPVDTQEHIINSSDLNPNYYFKILCLLASSNCETKGKGKPIKAVL